MTTTDQRTADTETRPADGSGWAVPGLHLSGPARPEPDVPGGDARGEDLASALAGAGGAGHPIVTAMLTCLEAMQSIRGVSAGTLTAKEIRVMLLAVMQVAAAVFALKLRLLVAGEVQRVADLTGATTTAAFFAHLTQTKRADANAQVRLAQDLDRRFPLLAAALEAGLMSPEHVKVAVVALRKLPRTLTTEQREDCQRFLIDAAQQWSTDQLKVLGRKLWEVIDPDGAERKEGEALEDEEELAKARAYFKSWRNGDGTTGFRGRLPDLHADIILKAIRALASPRRRKNPNIPTGHPDNVSRPEPKHADADAANGEPEAESGPAESTGQGPGCGACEDGQPPEEPDVPYPVRLGHALMDLIERLPKDALPRSGGTSARIMITMRLDQLLDGLGAATLDTGTTISAGQARRLGPARPGSSRSCSTAGPALSTSAGNNASTPRPSAR